MAAIFWIIGGALALYAAWWAIKILLAQTISPEFSGRALLKQELKRSGVDVSRIPDSAIDEIVQYCLSGARSMAMLNQLSSYGRAEDKNWRANLVRQIEAHVPMIHNIIAGERPSPADEKIREILIRNGVVRS